MQTITRALHYVFCNPGPSYVVNLAGAFNPANPNVVLPYDDVAGPAPPTACTVPGAICACPPAGLCPNTSVAFGAEVFPLVVRQKDVQIVWDQANSDAIGGVRVRPVVRTGAALPPPAGFPMLLHVRGYASPPGGATVSVRNLEFYGGYVDLYAPAATGIQPTLDDVRVRESAPAVQLRATGILRPIVRRSTLTVQSPALSAYIWPQNTAVINGTTPGGGTMGGDVTDATITGGNLITPFANQIRSAVRFAADGGGSITTRVDRATIASAQGSAPGVMSAFREGVWAGAFNAGSQESVSVVNSTMSLMGVAGVRLETQDTNAFCYPMVVGCTITDVRGGSEGAISIVDGMGATAAMHIRGLISGNTLKSNLTNAVRVFQSGSFGTMAGVFDLDVVQNVIEGNTGDGVQFEMANGTVLATSRIGDNLIRGNGGHAINHGVIPSLCAGPGGLFPCPAVSNPEISGNMMGFNTGDGIRNDGGGPLVVGTLEARPRVVWNTGPQNGGYAVNNIQTSHVFDVWNSILVGSGAGADWIGLPGTSFSFCRASDASGNPPVNPANPNFATLPGQIQLVYNFAGGQDMHLRANPAGTLCVMLAAPSYFHDRVTATPAPAVPARDFDGQTRVVDTQGVGHDSTGPCANPEIAECGADEIP